MCISLNCLAVVLHQDLLDVSSESLVSAISSSVPSDSSDATIILEKDSGLKRTHADRESAEAVYKLTFLMH